MIRKLAEGFSLIEILVTILILGTGLLTISSLQVNSLRQNHDSYVHTQANIVAYDVIDRVRALSDAPPGALNLLTNAQVTSLASVLPNGKGALACVARVCTVTITWDETQGTDAGGTSSTFTYTTSI